MAPLLIVALIARAAGGLARADDLRLIYAVGVTCLLASVMRLASVRRVALPRWIGPLFAGITAFILLVPVLRLYRIGVVVNRIEHFGAFAVLGAGMVAVVARWRGDGRAMRGWLLSIAWMVGMANEIVEYAATSAHTFFTLDTRLDVLMNTCALVAVGLAMPRTDRQEPERDLAAT